MRRSAVLCSACQLAVEDELVCAVIEADRSLIDALPPEPRVKRVRVAGAIPDESVGRVAGEALLKGGFMRRSTGHVNGDRKASAICHCHDLCPFARLVFPTPRSPFLR